MDHKTIANQARILANELELAGLHGRVKLLQVQERHLKLALDDAERRLWQKGIDPAYVRIGGQPVLPDRFARYSLDELIDRYHRFSDLRQFLPPVTCRSDWNRQVYVLDIFSWIATRHRSLRAFHVSCRMPGFAKAFEELLEWFDHGCRQGTFTEMPSSSAVRRRTIPRMEDRLSAELQKELVKPGNPTNWIRIHWIPCCLWLMSDLDRVKFARLRSGIRLTEQQWEVSFKNATRKHVATRLFRAQYCCVSVTDQGQPVLANKLRTKGSRA